MICNLYRQERFLLGVCYPEKRVGMASSIVIDGLGLDSCESIDDGDTDGFPPHKPNATGRQSQRGTGDRYTVHYSKREQTRRPARLLRLLT